MKRLQVLVASVVVALSCAATNANNLGYSVDFTGNNLYRIDFTAGTASLIGTTGVLIEDLALRSDNTLFGTTQAGTLYTINTATAASTLIGNTGLGDIEALAFNGANLIGVNFNSPPSIYSLNQLNAAPTLLATSNVNTGVVRSGAILDPNTMLIRGDTGGDSLYRMALAGGATTFVGPMGTTIYGMDFKGATLYGVSTGGRLYTINPLTGLTTQIGDTGVQNFLSLAMIPVPEPTSSVLLAAGGIALIGVAYRRRRKA
jgi:PEP-CTERM motif-containing protein